MGPGMTSNLHNWIISDLALYRAWDLGHLCGSCGERGTVSISLQPFLCAYLLESGHRSPGR